MRFKVILLAASLLLAGCFECERGVKSGYINKVSKQGLIFITYESSMMIGGITDGSGGMGNQFCFSIEDKKVFEDVELALNNKSEVIVNYHSELIVTPWRGKSNFIVDNVRVK